MLLLLLGICRTALGNAPKSDTWCIKVIRGRQFHIRYQGYLEVTSHHHQGPWSCLVGQFLELGCSWFSWYDKNNPFATCCLRGLNLLVNCQSNDIKGMGSLKFILDYLIDRMVEKFRDVSCTLHSFEIQEQLLSF